MTDATMRIDAHHHFWDPARYSYPWMAGDAMDPVRRAFAPDDLRGTLDEERVDGTVLVQTLSSPQETREFLDLAAHQVLDDLGIVVDHHGLETLRRHIARDIRNFRRRA